MLLDASTKKDNVICSTS